MWINEGNDELEILNVEVDFCGFKVRGVCGYDPQEDAPQEKKQNFWTLSMEVEGANYEEILMKLIIMGNISKHFLRETII